MPQGFFSSSPPPIAFDCGRENYNVRYRFKSALVGGILVATELLKQWSDWAFDVLLHIHSKLPSGDPIDPEAMIYNSLIVRLTSQYS